MSGGGKRVELRDAKAQASPGKVQGPEREERGHEKRGTWKNKRIGFLLLL